MKLKRLNSDVISKTRSSFSLNTVCQCIMELVFNSLDAKATAIAIRINLVTLRIQVVDNGEGISVKNMELIGNRYFTNKCKNLEDLEKGNNYNGFRGEALASLSELSKSINITSRYVNSTETHSKILGKCDNRMIVTKERPSAGTTVTVEGLFHNFPVRKKRIVNELELDEIKKNIFALIIIHPNVSFSLRNDVINELMITSRKTNDIPSAFKCLYPETKDGTVMKISKGKISINALLFKDYSENKKQYIYVNKKPIYSLKIQKLISKLFNKHLKNKRNSLGKKKINPIYVLNIKCPYTEVDILLNPSKTMAEFKSWERVEQCIEKLINSFFGKYRKEKIMEIRKQEETNHFECGVSQIHGVVRAYGYKRKNDEIKSRTQEKIQKIDETLFTTKSILKKTQNDNIGEANDIYNISETTPYKKEKLPFKAPLPITVKPKEKPFLCKQPQIDEDTLSKFTDDENKGKNLILNMFLKSTQVYNSDENISKLSQCSGDTLYEEESNLLIENNIETKFNGCSKTMSVSVNLKTTKKIKRLKNKMTQRCIQTTLENEMVSKGLQTTLDNKMVSKGLQTTLNDKLTATNDYDKNCLADNYTLVFSNSEKSKFKFVFKKPESFKDFNFAYAQNCNCNCHEKNIFSFEQPNYNCGSLIPNLDNINLTKKEKKAQHRNIDKNVNLKSVDQWKIHRKIKNNNNNQPMCEQSPYFKTKKGHMKANNEHDPLRNCMNQTSIFFNTNWDNTVGTFGQFKPIYKSTQYKQNLVEYDFTSDTLTAFKPTDFGVDKMETNLKDTIHISAQNHNTDLQNPITIGNSCGKKYKEDIFSENPKMNIENSDIKESELVITFSERDKLNLLEKELGEEKSMLIKEFLEWDSQFTPDENQKPQRDDWNWTKRNHFGSIYYVNKKTGYTTYQTPKQMNKFKLDERFDFLPKGMSPILKESKKVDQSLSQNGKNTLLEYILETYKNDLLFVKWQHYLKDILKAFFSNMYKEKIKMYETFVPNICAETKHQDIINLNKQVFEKLDVIGQLDKKFIVVRELKRNMLLIFDQHAVHERIRLEHLIKIYKKAKLTCKEKMIFFIPQTELSLLKRYESYLNHIGMTVEFFSNGIYVTEVPLCLSFKFKQENTTQALNDMVHILMDEVIEMIKSTRGVTLKILPKLVQNIINLEACRGAIKFGDRLNHKQCEELLQRLSKVDLPFQCAHGRPTVTPVIQLSNVNNNAVKRAINFKKLK